MSRHDAETYVDRHVATRGPGLTGVFKAGYDFGSLRAEFKYRVRTHGNNTSLVGSSTNLAKISKGREWSPVYPPVEFLSNHRVHHFFANAHYDFQNAARWTPFVGAGAPQRSSMKGSE